MKLFGYEIVSKFNIKRVIIDACYSRSNKQILKNKKVYYLIFYLPLTLAYLHIAWADILRQHHYK